MCEYFQVQSLRINKKMSRIKSRGAAFSVGDQQNTERVFGQISAPTSIRRSAPSDDAACDRDCDGLRSEAKNMLSKQVSEMKADIVPS